MASCCFRDSFRGKEGNFSVGEHCDFPAVGKEIETIKVRDKTGAESSIFIQKSLFCFQRLSTCGFSGKESEDDLFVCHGLKEKGKELEDKNKGHAHKE